MAFLLALYPVISPQVPRSRGVCAVYYFIKLNTITAVELELDSRTNIFGASDRLDALQDDRLKNNHLPGVPLPILYAVKLHCKDCDKRSPESTIRCIV